MANFPQGLRVDFYAWNQVFNIFQNEKFQKGTPVEFMSIDIRDPITTLLGDNSIEENIFGDAEVGAVGEEFIP